VVTAVAPHSKGVTEAAKRGWTPISANFLLPEVGGLALAALREGCEASGRKPLPADWRIAKSIFVADEDKSRGAMATARRGLTISTSSS
jgi:alkanesulfonate monooxygenase SsuD/methylene tetrahydromethanopterin reductase-like flavin-dependent oxidoreductase (luciferase family)